MGSYLQVFIKQYQRKEEKKKRKECVTLPENKFAHGLINIKRVIEVWVSSGSYFWIFCGNVAPGHTHGVKLHK
jgi:hypothetical protein